MTTTINPIENIGIDDLGYQARFPSDTGRGMGYSELKRLRESASLLKVKTQPKKFIKAAEGVQTVGKLKKKVKKGKKPENLRASEAKNQKRGPFGEKYTAPSGSKGKGVRVSESRHSRLEAKLARFRESVSTEDLRGMLQRSLKEKFPSKPYDPLSPCSDSGISPWIQDIFPEEHLVVFKMKDVLWGADYSLDKKEGKAKLVNMRRVETKYVDVDDGEEGDDIEESNRTREKAPPGWEGTVKHMKKHPEIDNPFALAWHMKGEGDTPHH